MFSTEGAEAKHKLTKLFAAAYSRSVIHFHKMYKNMNEYSRKTDNLSAMIDCFFRDWCITCPLVRDKGLIKKHSRKTKAKTD